MASYTRNMHDSLIQNVEELQALGLPVSVADAWRSKRSGGPADQFEMMIECGTCSLNGWVLLREFGDGEFACPCGAALPLEQRREIGFDLIRMSLDLPTARTRRVNNPCEMA